MQSCSELGLNRRTTHQEGPSPYKDHGGWGTGKHRSFPKVCRGYTFCFTYKIVWSELVSSSTPYPRGVSRPRRGPLSLQTLSRLKCSIPRLAPIPGLSPLPLTVPGPSLRVPYSVLHVPPVPRCLPGSPSTLRRTRPEPLFSVQEQGWDSHDPLVTS